jgi:hypothetical protein
MVGLGNLGQSVAVLQKPDRPNQQSPEATTTAVTPAAVQPARQP